MKRHAFYSLSFQNKLLLIFLPLLFCFIIITGGICLYFSGEQLKLNTEKMMENTVHQTKTLLEDKLSAILMRSSALIESAAYEYFTFSHDARDSIDKKYLEYRSSLSGMLTDMAVEYPSMVDSIIMLEKSGDKLIYMRSPSPYVMQDTSDLNGKISKGSIEANIEYDPNKKDLYAIPSSINVRNFWIRTDWYKENGIEIPETWDEFFDSVKKLADPANNRYGTTIRGGAGGAQNLEYMMYAYSGITEAFDENGKSTINDPLNVEFCEKYLSLYKEYTAEDDLNKAGRRLLLLFSQVQPLLFFTIWDLRS